MTGNPSDKFLSGKYKSLGNFDLQGKVYRGQAITATFPISYMKACLAMNSLHLKPLRLSFTKSLLNVTIFNYHTTPVGPYNELVYAIPVMSGSKTNLPLFPLLLQKLFKKHAFMVLNIMYSTEAAAGLGATTTGCPSSGKLIGVHFKHEDDLPCVKVSDQSGMVLELNTSHIKPKLRTEEQSYLTYFQAQEQVRKTRMDIFGMKRRVAGCHLHLGNHELSGMIRELDVSAKSVEADWYPEVTEVFPVALEIP